MESIQKILNGKTSFNETKKPIFYNLCVPSTLRFSSNTFFLYLALGQEMIKSKKARRDIIDGGWNRFMFDDKDSELPDWFVKEEQFHMRCHPEVDPNVVDFYKNRQKDVNVKTIKKVVEAKARKKRKLTKRMDKAKKRASNILENEDLGMYNWSF